MSLNDLIISSGLTQEHSTVFMLSLAGSTICCNTLENTLTQVCAGSQLWGKTGGKIRQYCFPLLVQYFSRSSKWFKFHIKRPVKTHKHIFAWVIKRLLYVELHTWVWIPLGKTISFLSYRKKWSLTQKNEELHLFMSIINVCNCLRRHSRLSFLFRKVIFVY